MYGVLDQRYEILGVTSTHGLLRQFWSIWQVKNEGTFQEFPVSERSRAFMLNIELITIFDLKHFKMTLHQSYQLS